MKRQHAIDALVLRSPDPFEADRVRGLLERVPLSAALQHFGVTPANIAEALAGADHVHRWACCAWRGDGTPGKQAVAMTGFETDAQWHVPWQFVVVDPDAEPGLDARMRAHLLEVIAGRGLKLNG
jgi:hypothetical protein